MPTVTINTGVVNDDVNVLKNVINPMPPYLKEHGEYVAELLVGTDFTSGDDVVLAFEGSTQIYHAVITTNDGTIKTYTEAAIGGGVVGQKLTMANCTTNLKCRVLYSI